MPRTATELRTFDLCSSDYDAYLNQALAATGEEKEYYARGRIRWLATCLAQLGKKPASVLDFGCGIGSSSPFLLADLGSKSVTGVDTSAKAIECARKEFQDERIQFSLAQDLLPGVAFDCAYCNGVFHHVAPGEWPAALAFVKRALRPGGLFAFWENNPWNPGTRYVMCRCEFDKDAVKISPHRARRMLKEAGFVLLRTDFLFFFPRALSVMRPLESALRKIPLGGQYQILCRKPLLPDQPTT